MRAFTLRVSEQTWQIDFENLRLPVFSPLLRQGIVLKSHKRLYEALSKKLLPAKRQEAGHLVFVSGLAGLGKSRLVQHYLHQQDDQKKAETRHAMVAWLSGQDQASFDKQWQGLAKQFRSIDSEAKALEDNSEVIKKWFEEKQSNWLLVIDGLEEMNLEALLKRLPMKGGHVVITTRHPPASIQKAVSCPHTVLTFSPLSETESKRLVQMHFGEYWQVTGHAQETQALDILVRTLGGFPQGLVQAATHIRKKGISLTRYVTQLNANSALQWQMLSDTVFGQFQAAETMAYLWGSSKRLLLEALTRAVPDVSQHEEILMAWLKRLVDRSKLPEEKEHKPVAAGISLPLTLLEQDWQQMMKAQFPALLKASRQLWACYQRYLPAYLPIRISGRQKAKAWQMNAAAYAVLVQNFPEAASSQEPLSPIALEEKQEGKQAVVPVSYQARLGAGSRVNLLQAEVLTITDPEALLAWQLPPDNPDFIPRPYATKELAKKLSVVRSSEQKTQLVVMTAVSGMGGVGKTELARHYLHHSEDPKIKQHYKRRLWMNASSASEMSLEFRKLGRRLQLFEPKASEKEVREKVHEWLRIHPGWLLIFDNADAYQEIAEWIPQKGGTALITTRDKAPGSLTSEQIVRLEILAAEEAVGWLFQLARRDQVALSEEEKIAAFKLVEALGYLPLAVVQVAAYLRIHSEESIAAYLERFNQYPIPALMDLTLSESKASGSRDPDAASRLIVAKTWAISLKAIEERSKQQGKLNTAQQLLMVCAYLAPRDIPVSPLEIWLNNDPAHTTKDKDILSYWLDEYVGQLLGYSLVQRSYQSDAVSVHELVQVVARQQDKQEDEKEKELEKKPSFKRLQGLVSVLKSFNFDADCRFLHYRMGLHIKMVTKWSDQLLEEEQQSSEVVKNGMRELYIGLIKIYTELGGSHQYLGSPKEAARCYRKAHDFCVKVYGKSSIEVAKSCISLGDAYRVWGESDKAVSSLIEASEILEGASKKEEDALWWVYFRMGQAYRDGKRFEEAVKSFKKALEHKLYQGRQPIINAIVYTDIGQMYRLQYGSQGKKQELETEMLFNSQKAVEICKAEKVGEIPENDRYIPLRSYRELGKAYKACGKLQESLKVRGEDMLREVKILHPDGKHADWGVVYSDLGDIHQAMKEYEKALLIQKKALDILLQPYSYGKEAHYEVAESYSRLGEACQGLGFLKEAFYCQKKAYDINIRCNLDTNYPSTVMYSRLMKEAYKAWEKAGKANNSQSYKDASGVADCINKLGTLLGPIEEEPGDYPSDQKEEGQSDQKLKQSRAEERTPGSSISKLDPIPSDRFVPKRNKADRPSSSSSSSSASFSAPLSSSYSSLTSSRSSSFSQEDSSNSFSVSQQDKLALQAYPEPEKDSFAFFLLDQEEKLEEQKDPLQDYLTHSSFSELGMALPLDCIAEFVNSLPKLITNPLSEKFYPQLTPETLRLWYKQILEEARRIRSSPRTENLEQFPEQRSEEDIDRDKNQFINLNDFVKRTYKLMETVTDVLVITQIAILISGDYDAQKAREKIKALLNNPCLAKHISSKAIIIFAYWKNFPFDLLIENKELNILLKKLTPKQREAVCKILEKESIVFEKLNRLIEAPSPVVSLKII